MQTTAIVVALMLLSVALAAALSQPMRLMVARVAKSSTRVAARVEIAAFSPDGQVTARNLGPDTIPAGTWHVIIDTEVRGEARLQELKPGEAVTLGFQPVDPTTSHFVEVSGPAGVTGQAGWTP